MLDLSLLENKVSFGKYKNQTIEYIIVFDISYFEWMIKNVENNGMSKDVRSYYKQIVKENEYRKKNER